MYVYIAASIVILTMNENAKNNNCGGGYSQTDLPDDNAIDTLKRCFKRGW